MEAVHGWVNGVLSPQTLIAYVDDALHHLKMAIWTVFGHFKHQEAKSKPISTNMSNKRIPITWELPKDGWMMVKMVILTVFGHFKHQEAKSNPFPQLCPISAS